MVFFVILGTPPITRTLSEDNIKDKMHERYIIAQDQGRKTVMRRIKYRLKLCDPKEKKYQFEVPSTRAAIYDPRMGHYCLPRIHGRFKRRSTQDPATAEKAMRLFFILKTVLKNMRRKNPPMCQKEIFYKDKKLFMRDSKKEDSRKVKDSKDSDDDEVKKDYKINFIPLMNEVCILLETTRLSLNVSVTPKGYIIGEVNLYLNGDSISCKGGQVISDDTYHVTRIKTKGKILFILIVEKFTMYSKLKKMGFHRKHNCIIITPQGFPSVAARYLLRILWDKLRIPIYGLVDLNVSVLLILSTFTIGSIERAFDNLGLNVPAITWIGVLPSDVNHLKHIPSTPVTSQDRKKMKNLLDLYNSEQDNTFPLHM